MIEEIIEKEICLFDAAKKSFENGNIDKAEFNSMIFMFNLQKDLTLIQIATYMRKKIIGKECCSMENNREGVDKQLDKFIGSMKLPLYDHFKKVYYYDILEGLTRTLF